MADNFTAYAIIPSKGGLSYQDYPNPYGVRAYKTKNGYEGEMLPKSSGYLGPLQGTGKNKNDVMTEYSLTDDKGTYPSLVPTLSPQEIKMVLNGQVTKEIDRKAKEFRDSRLEQGLSPFYNEFNP